MAWNYGPLSPNDELLWGECLDSQVALATIPQSRPLLVESSPNYEPLALQVVFYFELLGFPGAC